MFELETPRLYLIETPLHVVQARLEQDDFEAEIVIAGQTQCVHFPPEWPGDALGFFPALAERLRREADALHAGSHWSSVLTLIEKAGRVAVGNMGTKGPPDGTGTVDIGYGMNASFEGRGSMTEAVQAYTGWLLTRPEVRRVTADCLSTNTGSVRVLEKAGFVRLGERYDEGAGGTLIFWEKRG